MNTEKSQVLKFFMGESLRYFVPEISDIRVGYEGEQAYLYQDNWKPFKLRHPEETAGFLTGIYNRRIRVPYLTKEQIESEDGFKKIEGTWAQHMDNKSVVLEKGNYWFIFRVYGGKYYLQITPIDLVKEPSHDHIPKFNAECKDINTFRYITKLLGI